jgi:hypothetical protein
MTMCFRFRRTATSLLLTRPYLFQNLVRRISAQQWLSYVGKGRQGVSRTIGYTGTQHSAGRCYCTLKRKSKRYCDCRHHNSQYPTIRVCNTGMNTINGSLTPSHPVRRRRSIMDSPHSPKRFSLPRGIHHFPSQQVNMPSPTPLSTVTVILPRSSGAISPVIVTPGKRIKQTQPPSFSMRSSRRLRIPFTRPLQT